MAGEGVFGDILAMALFDERGYFLVSLALEEGVDLPLLLFGVC